MTTDEAAREARPNPSEPALPSGTLTFLFSDIEGSTQLVQELGPEPYADVLQRHRELLRAAWAAHHGTEIGTEGDSFFVVFPSAPDALTAAIDGQRALAAGSFPHGVRPVRVRMGLHTGLGIVSSGSYVGNDVNRAARIAAAANGGQVLLSSTTVALVADSLPPGVRPRDLGEHRLKDLRPEHLAILEIDDLPADPRPIRSLDNRPNNLPTQVTSFVGRATELAETTAQLGSTRLLTLTGPGGTGKTRLSLQLAAAAAEAFPDGVYFVALEPIREPALVAPTIAGVLGVAEEPATPIGTRLASWIAERRLLLVLDNFEQVIEAAPVIAELLRATTNLKVIVSSRAALRVSGEQEYPVPGLPTPPDPTALAGYDRAQLSGAERATDPETLGGYESVRLFVARAGAVKPGFHLTPDNAAAVAGIVARLQGMPLAIELAAARIKLLPPESILIRLGDQLAALGGGARDLTERQQTLRGAIAWSYDLLDQPGARLLRRLSVFAAGCSLVEAEQVCGPPDELGVDVLDGIGVLVDQSLVRAEEVAGEPRFRMLETIRAFTSEQLDASGELDIDPGSPRRRLPRPGRGCRPEAVRRGPAGLARPARCRARQLSGGARMGDRPARTGDRLPPRVCPVAVLAEAGLPGRGSPAARSDRGRALVARRSGPPGAGPRGPWRRRLVAGRHLGDDRLLRRGAQNLAPDWRPGRDRQCPLQRLVQLRLRRRRARRGDDRPGSNRPRDDGGGPGDLSLPGRPARSGQCHLGDRQLVPLPPAR